jgi:hypothetical protein
VGGNRKARQQAAAIMKVAGMNESISQQLMTLPRDITLQVVVLYLYKYEEYNNEYPLTETPEPLIPQNRCQHKLIQQPTRTFQQKGGHPNKPLQLPLR